MKRYQKAGVDLDWLAQEILSYFTMYMVGKAKVNPTVQKNYFTIIVPQKTGAKIVLDPSFHFRDIQSVVSL